MQIVFVLGKCRLYVVNNNNVQEPGRKATLDPHDESFISGLLA